MTPSEAAELLVLCSAYDNRTIGDGNALAWADVLNDVRLADAKDAVKAHYRRSAEFLHASEVRERVRALREARLAEAAEPIPPHEFLDDPEAYKAWMRQARSRIADGDHVEQPALGHRALPDLSRVFPSMPRPRYSP